MAALTRARIQLHSTTLAAAAYDDTQNLELHFSDGTSYLYSGVAPKLYQDLLLADSKGSFFNRYIRGRFDYVKLPREN
jgi:hypothetical protein